MRESSTTSTLSMRRRFGLYIRHCREDVGMTQAAVAQRLHIDHNMVSQVERGITALPTHNLVGWADALGVDARELAERFTYFNHPDLYHCLFGQDPHAVEELPRPKLTRRSAPGRPARPPPRKRQGP